LAHIIEVAQREGSSERIPKTSRNVLRLVESKLPEAMIAIAKIAGLLGIPSSDAIELVKLAEADGLLATWSDTFCFLSQAVAKERGLVLVSTPDRGRAHANEWYWIRSQGEDANGYEHGDIDPWRISLKLLPGSRRNRLWCRERLRQLATGTGLGPSCKCFSDLASDPSNPVSDEGSERGSLLNLSEFADPRSTTDPMEEDQRRERLLEIAQWDAEQRLRQLPPRRRDRQGRAKSDRSEYSQSMRPGPPIGISHPGWTPAHEMIQAALEQDTSILGQRMTGFCSVCNGRELKTQEACMGCCRSGLDWWLDMVR
jgi:hypothetical protein